MKSCLLVIEVARPTILTQKYQSAYIKDLRNIDIFGIKILNGRSCIFGMFYRNGTNYGNKAFFPSHDENANSFEILE